MKYAQRGNSWTRITSSVRLTRDIASHSPVQQCILAVWLLLSFDVIGATRSLPIRSDTDADQSRSTGAAEGSLGDNAVVSFAPGWRVSTLPWQTVARWIPTCSMKDSEWPLPVSRLCWH